MPIQERKAQYRANIRQDILDAARELFARDGYESTSIRKVAERTGYAPGTIYLYFRDKAEMLGCVCEETFSRLHQRLEAIVEDKGADPLDALRRGLRAYIEFGLQNPNHYVLTFVLPTQPGVCMSVVCEAGGKCFGSLRAAVERCVAKDLLRLEDAEEATQALWAGVHGVTSLLITKPGFPYVERTRLVDRVVDVLIEGVRR